MPSFESTSEKAPTPGPCVSRGTSSLPGVRYEIRADKCSFTNNEAVAGQKATIELVVDVDVLIAQYLVCPETESRTDLDFSAALYGGVQNDAGADAGAHAGIAFPMECGPGPELGPPVDVVAFTLKKGRYSFTFDWVSKDCSNNALPPGDYAIRVASQGFRLPPPKTSGATDDAGAVGGAGGQATAFALNYELPITILRTP